MSGIELQETLAERGITIPIIITGYGDVPAAAQAMKGRAADFIVRRWLSADGPKTREQLEERSVTAERNRRGNP